MLEAGLFDFMGSDVHSHRLLDAVERMKLSRKHLQALRVLMETNASIFEQIASHLMLNLIECYPCTTLMR